eukprot:CAMPEP_0172327566 /NCGR_PEP_ID=MMETSP1058-20130122/59901_1 /TAXON_ID=83371 /ORGANISM="Detonula confervacea, Strain CCMP 353" /LENGTH=452 /DNA_ID=CAMNT_0013044647 /DNA_START=153 /DNA_END=1511 /DNA_ORIENTATION=-
MKRRNRLIPFLAFFLIKALCSLVMLNFYMGSQISIVKLEDSLSLMLHRDNHKVNGGNRVASNIANGSSNAQTESNSTIQKITNSTLDQSNSKHDHEGGMITPNLSDGTLQGKERLWDILQTRNVTQVDAEYWASIPTWNTILHNIHRKSDIDGDNNASPIIYGLETCEAFQNATSSNPSQRRIAPAGIFNTGTNYLSVLLEYNCQNPHRVEKLHGNAKRGHGNEWEVPWGKHSPASSRGKYTKNPKSTYTVDEVLPIVLIRNPYGWMKSMCRNPYTAKWKGGNDKKTCPQLKTKERGANSEEYNPVDVKYGSGTTHHKSLGHLWNDWYGEYIYNENAAKNNEKTDAQFPRLVIRFEDIIYYPYEVTKQICTCAGGVLGHRQDDKDVADDTFHYVVRSAKAGVGHGPASQRNGLIDSWTKYGNGDPKDAYSEEEVQIAKGVLDSFIMDTFGYS